ncbi:MULTISPECIES: DUF2690 domain-containing protein [unclassified Streptomyces]|uniref:DUF2690 domain-containing protein n=1 Tax=Streptomyces TaxID=1883 RepID=UPI000F7B7576|nr:MULTISPECIES: DUF2690 domain-containing protein [unclassified Streptomyces]RSS55346.1 DUF2690 domain-containing protein [Streptomyces sp. WAC01280]
MNALTRKLATVGSALAMAASGLLFASSPASAATSCYAETCHGLDPATTICANDAQTVLRDRSGNLELRYSPQCRTTWARQAYGLTGRITVNNSQGAVFAADYTGQGAAWTRMVNDKDIVAWACGNWTNGTYGCTNKY